MRLFRIPVLSAPLSSALSIPLWSALCAGLALAQVPAPPPAPAAPPTTSTPATAQDDDPALPGTPPGAAREAMWYAPTAEDWAKPVLIQWERTWADAVAVSKETKKPILVCINMDGEIASEHYAGVRYRQPEVAALFAPYVCVIASVYRHNPRDYDEQGRRIECPRFHGVTCGEHIAMEPVVYEQFLDQRRISPRHIMVELDGKEVYDVFYAFDTKSVFRSIRKGIVERTIVPNPENPEAPTILERVVSARASDKVIVEQAYIAGDRELRRELLATALENGAAAPIDLLRLAIFGLDVELSRLAREALAQSDAPGAVDLIAEALRVPLTTEERNALIAALERLGATDESARTLAVVHRGLGAESGAVRAGDWAKQLAGAGPVKAHQGINALSSKIDYSHAAAEARPEDPTARLELAESFLSLGVDPETARAVGADRRTSQQFTRFIFEDALRAGEEAEAMGATGWRVDAAIGLAHYYLGELEDADTRAERAANAVPAGDTSWHAMAVLGLFAEARQRQIRALLRERKEVPPALISDVHATYSILAHHPLGTEEQVLAHVDFLRRFRAVDRANEALDRGLAKYPDSTPLHARLRGRLLEEGGPALLIPTYERLLAEPDAPVNLPWFAAFAALIAAEFHVRGGEDELGAAAYSRSLEWWDRSIAASATNQESADHYAALALMGRGRLAMQGGALDPALADMLASFQRRPLAANAVDGLGHYGTANARMLGAKLADAGRAEDAARLDAALAALPPEALAPPDFELERPRDDGRGVSEDRPAEPRRRRPRASQDAAGGQR
jgi:tetratricopeptide (TPR) repeat protein